MAGELRMKLIRIGNSRGIRLPRSVIEQAGLHDDVLVSVGEGEVVVRPAPRHPREGWEEAILALGPPEDEDLADFRNMPTEFDDTEWTW